MPHAETPDSSPLDQNLASSAAPAEEPNHDLENEIDPMQEDPPSSPPVQAPPAQTKPGGLLEDMFDDDDDDEFTFSGAPAPM